MSSLIKVGRRVKNKDPKVEGYKSILCLTPNTPYGDISPFVLKDEQHIIMENKYQFNKVYSLVPKSVQKYSRFDSNIIWDHPKEQHIDNDGFLTKEWFDWCRKGMKSQYAIRYPVGLEARHECIGAVPPKYFDDILKGNNPIIHTKELLSYIDARKQIYIPEYSRLAVKTEKFYKLIEMVKKGQKLLIIEIDGPHQESLQYYKDKYKVNDNFIEDNTIDVTEENMIIMRDDTKHAYGHGYCLAVCILEALNQPMKKSTII